jgi:acyl-CoA thioesterase I
MFAEPSAAAKSDCHQCAGRDDEAAVFIPGRPKKIVFLGDSTTHFWLGSPWFQQYLGQGIFIEKGVGGDKTTGMLARFQTDVIDQHPDVVVILGGANDARFWEYQEWESEARLKQMYDLAEAAGIRVVACTIMPVRGEGFVWANPSINRQNDWIRAYGRDHNITVLDYWPLVLDPETNALRVDYSYDSVHMNPKGYAAITPVTDVAVRPYWIPASP